MWFHKLYSNRKFENIPQKRRLQNSSGTKYIVQYHNLTMIYKIYKKNIQIQFLINEDDFFFI